MDNTLREGEQTPGVAFGVDDKLEVLARLLDAGVTSFDAAFPESGEDERAFVRQASELLDSGLGVTCRLRRQAIEDAIDLGATDLFVVVPVSDVHLEKRLCITRSDLLDRVDHELTGLAGDLAGHAALDVVLEDAFRADTGFLREALLRSVDVGARRIFLSDTVGVVLPDQVARLVADVRSLLPPHVEIGTHFHNDFGLAVASSLAAIGAGATAPTAAVNGLGERAGNTNLAELCAALRLLLGRECSVRLDHLPGLSKLLMGMTGILVSQTAPIVGHNAFRHTSGMHVHGLLRDTDTYEAIDPARFGAASGLVLGKHSGRAHVEHVLDGEPLEAGPLADLLVEIKRLSVARAHDGRPAQLLAAFEQFNAEALGIGPEEVLELLGRARDRR